MRVCVCSVCAPCVLLVQEAVGAHQYWSFSPAFDAQELHRKALPASSHDDSSSSEPLRVLLVMPGDVNTIIKTVAQRFRHSKRPIHVRCLCSFVSVPIVSCAVTHVFCAVLRV